MYNKSNLIETKNIIKNNNFSSQYQDIDNLRQQYSKTLTEIKNLKSQISDATSQYINRNTNNPYLGKNVIFSSGEIAYVTKKGIVKIYPNQDIYRNAVEKNGCSDKNPLQINMSWLPEYNSPGTFIPSNPPLISGTNMIFGQSCANEDVNVFVDKVIDSSITTTYRGCYSDDVNTPSMTFIGPTPPPSNNLIKNGDFNIFNGSGGISVRNWGASMFGNFDYPSFMNDWTNDRFTLYKLRENKFGKYPYGDYSISLTAPHQTLHQTVQLNSGVNYTLSWASSGYINTGDPVPAYPVNVKLYDTNNKYISTIYNFTPPIKQWQDYSVKFSVNNSGNYVIYFSGDQPIIDSNRNSVQETTIQHISLFAETIQGNYTYNDCKQSAIDKGYQYFALQKVNPQTSKGICAISKNMILNSNNINIPIPNVNSFPLWSSNTSGNPGAIALLTTGGQIKILDKDQTVLYMSSPGAPQYITGQNWLKLQDDGNLWIYSGTPGPNGTVVYPTNRGIWQSSTGINGKPNEPNLAYTALNGKYGTNYMVQDTTLASGDFVGSTNGNLALIMGDDGNLVLHLFQSGTQNNVNASTCIKMADGNVGGGNVTNALYDIGGVGFINNMNKLAYVDDNLELHEYSNDYLQKYPRETYTKMVDFGSPGNDIPGAGKYGNESTCIDVCNKTPGCVSVEYQPSQQYCFPKNSNAYPNGKGINAKGSTLFVKNTNKLPSQIPKGIPENVNNIDTVTYQNLEKGENVNLLNDYTFSTAAGLNKRLQPEQIKLQKLQNQLDSLTGQINSLTGQFGNGLIQSQNQSTKNIKDTTYNASEVDNTNTKIKFFDTNVGNILNDSDIVVLQKNYNYLLWTILAAGLVLVSMNVINK